MTAAVASLPDVPLTQRQASLLDELTEVLNPSAAGAAAVSSAAASGANAEAACDGAGGEADYEAFYQHWRRVKTRHRLAEVEHRRSQWSWIDQVQELCASCCSELDALLTHLSTLDEQRREVIRKTTALHEQCEQMVKDQENLGKSTEALGERLDYYDRVADVARLLDQGTATSSLPEFTGVLDQLDGSIAFLETHHDFCQAQAYLHQFEHLRNRACISLRSALQRSLEKSLAQVEQQLKEKASGAAVDTQVFYTRFRAAALNYKPLMTLLHKRMDVHETYAVTLEELEAFYVHQRIRLVTAPVTVHLQTLLHRQLEQVQLAPATRQASSYILDVSHFEKQTFEAYFELRQPQESLRMLLETVADIFYKAVRPVVIACDSIDSLREMADCLQMDILEPHQHQQKQTGKAGEMVPVMSVVYRLHKDVQERLIFCVENYIRHEIRLFQAGAQDLDYPSVLFESEPGTDAAANVGGAAAFMLQKGWYPTLGRTLTILEKIYRVLEMSTFQGLAQEAVDLCIASLKKASNALAKKAPSGGQQVAQSIDAQLFLVRHLLALRERVAAFECDLVVSEKHFNFSNVWEALHLRMPDGVLGILKPKVKESQVDSKKDIEAELKAACESLITYLAAQITQPLASLNGQIGDFLSRPGVERAKLKEQPFMTQEKLGGAVQSFMDKVRERVPFAAAHIRLYLAASTGGAPGTGEGAAAGGHSTAGILFKPVEMRLVDTWGRLEGLVDECQIDSTELERSGFVPAASLRELVASLFEKAMSQPWAQLIADVTAYRGMAPPQPAASGAGAAPPVAPVDSPQPAAPEAPQAPAAPLPADPAPATPSADPAAPQPAGDADPPASSAPAAV